MNTTYKAEKVNGWYRWTNGKVVSAPMFTSHDAAVEAGRDHGYRNGYRSPVLNRDGSIVMVKA